MAGGYAGDRTRQAVLVHVECCTPRLHGDPDCFVTGCRFMLFAGRAPYTLHGELPGSRTLTFISCRTRRHRQHRQAYVKWNLAPLRHRGKEAIGPRQCVRAKRSAVCLHDAAAGKRSPNNGTLPTCPPIRRRGMARAHRRHRACAGRCTRSIDDGEKTDRTDGYLAASAAVARAGRLARSCGIRVAEFNSIDLNIRGLALLRRLRSLPLLEQADLACCWIRMCRHSAICQRAGAIMDPDRHRSF